jgi:hypothetical protein
LSTDRAQSCKGNTNSWLRYGFAVTATFSAGFIAKTRRHALFDGALREADCVAVERKSLLLLVRSWIEACFLAEGWCKEFARKMCIGLNACFSTNRSLSITFVGGIATKRQFAEFVEISATGVRRAGASRTQESQQAWRLHLAEEIAVANCHAVREGECGDVMCSEASASG